MRLSRFTLQRLARTLLMVLLFNVGAYASQTCAAAFVAPMDNTSSTEPCDMEDGECLADLQANDGTIRSRLTVSPHDGPPTQALIVPVVSSPSPVSHQQARAPSDRSPSPLLLRICRLLF